MREDPARLSFSIQARDGAARAGLIRTAHGEIETPAFVPLATKGSVRGLSSRELDELGYGLLFGNTFHLFLAPGPERIERLGGLHRFMGWEGSLITDSGGFQVFSLAHGGVSDEVKGRRDLPDDRGRGGTPAKVEISERGVAFRSLLDGSDRFLGPEESMAVQASLGSDIALAFDECTPFHADRDYTASSMERTHRWLDRCLEWHGDSGPERQAVYGIVQGGTHEDLRRESCEAIAARGVDGIAIGGSLGRDKAEMFGVVDMCVPNLPEEPPRHLLGVGEVDDLLEGIARGIDSFDCAVPTRLARHGVALAFEPGSRFRLDLAKGRFAEADEPVSAECACEACRHHSRAYLHHLARARDLTAARLLAVHNLSLVRDLTAGARAAIASGGFAEYRRALLGGEHPRALAGFPAPGHGLA